MTDEFADQFIEPGSNTPVKKTTGKPRPRPATVADLFLLKEAEASVRLDKGDEQTQSFGPDKPKLTDLLTEEDKALIADLSTEDERVVAHALEILPHLGPEVTAAYLRSVAGGEHAQHE